MAIEILYIGNGWDWGVPSISFWLGLISQVEVQGLGAHWAPTGQEFPRLLGASR